MSLLTICQDVAREVGVTVPSSVIGNDEQTASRLRGLASRSGKRLARSFDWSVLQKEDTITTADGTASYSLPSDFDRFIDLTSWDNTNNREIHPATPAEWQFRKNAILATSDQSRAFRVKANSGSREYFVDPTPSSADTLKIEYVSKNWVQKASDSTFTDDWVADGDTAVIDEEMIELDVRWRFLMRLGLPYSEDKDEFILALEKYIASETPKRIVDMSHGREQIMFPNIPETGAG